MEFLPTSARIVGGKIPTDRLIDGVDQTELLLGMSETGNRGSLLSFIEANMQRGRLRMLASCCCRPIS